MTGDDFGRELQRLRDVQVAEAVAVAWESAARAIVASGVIYAWEAVEVVRAAAPKPVELVADASGGPEFERDGAVRVLWPYQTGVGTLGRVGFDVRDRFSRAPGLFGGSATGQFRAASTHPPLDERPQLFGARRVGDPFVLGPQLCVDADALPLGSLGGHLDHLPCLDTPKRIGVVVIDPCE